MYRFIKLHIQYDCSYCMCSCMSGVYVPCGHQTSVVILYRALCNVPF